MTNEQKCKELYHKYRELNLAPESAAFNAALEMAEWKEQEIIKKAWDWFNEHFDVNIYEEIGGRKAAEILTYDFKSFASMFEDFKKIIKEE